MKTVIVSFDGEESKIARSRLKNFVQIISNGHEEVHLEFWGYKESGYVAKISLTNGLPLGEFNKVCEQCGIENGTLNSVH